MVGFRLFVRDFRLLRFFFSGSACFSKVAPPGKLQSRVKYDGKFASYGKEFRWTKFNEVERVREREREREREPEQDRARERERESKRVREKEKERGREREWEEIRECVWERDIERDSARERERKRKREREREFYQRRMNASDWEYIRLSSKPMSRFAPVHLSLSLIRTLSQFLALLQLWDPRWAQPREKPEITLWTPGGRSAVWTAPADWHWG